ncbi:dTDP-4-dehydrorhamnose reductase [Leptospira ryugenii]|uniref:dTDP-4-dehydrorhamnose reductase n=1 Tax=Leptospira ryugenii TaxID=1917863 RepID=A0A2P2DVX7_9LEPT|nr:dTDP-4-dehydrorhamnose reductase [Leptospira ryugenii]GBF48784.1 dTDP-4-dehydrorhamnose reductase [Leptospira ryugenii]
MIKVLVTGASGQLGSEIREVSSRFRDQIEIVYLKREDLSLDDESSVSAFLKENQIQTIINAAAYTAVDLAEKEIESAELGNALIPEVLAKVCAKLNLRLIHISTDFVFNGESNRPLKETEKISPVSIYGKSKAKGEELVLAHLSNAVVIRTSWLYSKFGNNFMKTMMRLSKERKELRVIYDQIGTPTWARDLAVVCLCVVVNPAVSGIYHYSNEGVASWYDFAFDIVQAVNPSVKVFPIETKDYPTPARRPAYSVLDKSKIKEHLKIEIPHWRKSLELCLKEIN